MKSWKINSWKKYQAFQQPNWPDQAIYNEVINKISDYPPLVFAKEIDSLKNQLNSASQGEAFVIQGGDCAETFNDFKADSIKNKLKILLQMAIIITHGAKFNVIKVGRIAGQFAKPRSSDTETRNLISLPSYRGDAVNSIKFDTEARMPNPNRIIQSYNQSAATLNLLRAFINGGFADLDKVHIWNNELIKKSKLGKKYQKIANEIQQSIEFIKSIGINNSSINIAEFFTSHEALLLDYESALTRVDSLSGNWYDCSAHFLWVGDRTRQLAGAHIEFLSGVNNPIGIKIGPKSDNNEIIKICQKLNPINEGGKLSLITRFGYKNISEKLPKLIKKIKDAKINVLWLCDPMHANTFKSRAGYKTRHFDSILKELSSFFRIHKEMNTIAGGVHFEFTGDDVTECLGGSVKIKTKNLEEKYETACDPRLNNEQSLELAFLISDFLKK